MSLASFFAQLLNGLAGASALFLVAAGLTLIFGVTRVVNFAHGSLYMLGAYLAYTLVAPFGRGPLGFWGAVVVAALAVALIGAAIEVLLLKRIYAAPELLQLAATFGVVLIVRDARSRSGAPRTCSARARPGLRGAIEVFGRAIPTYDLFLLAVGPLVLLALWWLLERTRFGMLTRAATENRMLASALGVDERRLFTAVFALGAFLAGARRRAAAAARAGEPRHGPRDHRRSLRRHGRRRTGLDSRRVRRRAADRAHEGAVHRARHASRSAASRSPFRSSRWSPNSS